MQRLAGGKLHDEIPLWMNACMLFRRITLLDLLLKITPEFLADDMHRVLLTAMLLNLVEDGTNIRSSDTASSVTSKPRIWLVSTEIMK